jgi:hypothetical protein
MSVLEVKRKAWDLVLSGEKQKYDRQWCNEFIESYRELNRQHALLMDDLVNIFYAYRQGKCDFETTKIKCEERIKEFEQGVM